MKKIAVVYCDVNRVGGGGAVVCNILEALKNQFDVTLVTDETPDFDRLNDFYGTQLSDKDIEVEIPKVVYIVNSDFPLFGRKIEEAVLFGSIEDEYDLVFSAKGEFEKIGDVPGIQYIHFPKHINRRRLKREDEVKLKEPSDCSFPRNLYLWVYYKLWGMDKKAISRNRTLCNSGWTRAKFERVYRSEADVITPPVFDEFDEVPWEEREDGFVSVGRLSEKKNQLELIQLIAELRSNWNTHLHIVGQGESEYAKKIKKQGDNCEWIHFEGECTEQEMNELLSEHKYGLHGHRQETYGIVLAEMKNAGCIPFTFNEGGQTEILDNKRLLFNSFGEAKQKIKKVIEDNELQRELKKELKENKPNNLKEFQKKILQEVRNTI